ncbi:cobalamin-binding protein [Undibacterium rugosum]|uniref:cobalamin-binding protein n=1 Tax=Undibacterium rugosum TaxID=2762291 RepID=UPI001B82DE4B|nr:cobalamin-binding protein [Undibacterium rugosum]MBR7779705.1 cobalamin-binding protein [Undibacterium rugosum]
MNTSLWRQLAWVAVLGSGLHLPVYAATASASASAAPVTAPAQLTVTDDLGRQVTLSKPAQRVISLAPHVTELIFAAGAGDKIVATVSYSDFPEAAKAIPRIGDLRQLDMERILAAKPDLIVVWMHGAFDRQLELLKQSGVPFFFSEPHQMEHIPETLSKLGLLMGTSKKAELAATDFRTQWQQITSRYAQKPIVRTFYQVWNKPLYTLNEKHIINDVLRSCGGENIYGKLAATAPVVGLESVLQENPELILAAENKKHAGQMLEQWKSFPTLLANKNHNLVAIDGDLMNRPGPRLIDGARAMCEALELARQHRQSGTPSSTAVTKVKS